MMGKKNNEQNSIHHTADMPTASSPPADYPSVGEPSSPSLLKSYSFGRVGSFAGSFIEQTSWEAKAEDARPLLPRAAFFMGDLRDGLPMVGVAAFLSF